jgi:hypothetical protein
MSSQTAASMNTQVEPQPAHQATASAHCPVEDSEVSRFPVFKVHRQAITEGLVQVCGENVCPVLRRAV